MVEFTLKSYTSSILIGKKTFGIRIFDGLESIEETQIKVVLCSEQEFVENYKPKVVSYINIVEGEINFFYTDIVTINETNQDEIVKTINGRYAIYRRTKNTKEGEIIFVKWN